MEATKQTVTLTDAYGECVVETEVTVEIVPGGSAICITPAGYGDHNSNDGKGCPIIFEFRNGIPYVMIWADINQEDATHVISLEDAKESKRIE